MQLAIARGALVGALLGMSVLTALGADNVVPAPAQAGAPDEGAPVEVWESTRKAVRASSEWLARGVDSWFGDKPFEQGGSVKDGRISLGFLALEGAQTDVDLRFNARFRLPNLGERGYLFLGRDNRTEVLTDRPGTLTNRQRLRTEARSEQGFFAGLGLTLHDAFDLRLGFRGGLKPYVQARYRRSWALSDADTLDFRQTFFWSSSDRLGSTTAVSLEHVLSPRLVAQWLQVATVTQAAPDVEWSGVAGLHRSLSRGRTVAVEVVYAGRQGSGVGLTDYGTRLRWEQPLYRDWLRAEVIIGHFWPRADAAAERGRAWAAGGTLKMRF